MAKLNENFTHHPKTQATKEAIKREKMAPGFMDQDSVMRHAYVTFLAGDGDYVKGVVGLAKGLRNVGAAFPLVVAVLPDVPEEHRRIVAEQGCLVREIKPVLPVNSDERNPYAKPYFGINYCKLRLWEFVEYNKMVYMDADIQVFDNIDDIFDLPAASAPFAGVVDCLCDAHGCPCSEKIRWPEELGTQPRYYFNGGLFMFHPSLHTCNELLRTLEITPTTAFAEQDFLSMFFRDVSEPIPPVYNLLVAMIWRHPQWVELDKVKVVHYCVDGSKPWRYTGEEDNMKRPEMKMLVKKWWDIYLDEDLDFKGNGCGIGRKPSSHSEANMVAQYTSAPSAA